METLSVILASQEFLLGWAATTALCLAILIRDLATGNRHLMPLMKLVWALTVLYSGPLGLAGYWLTGRKEIPDDALPRRAFRSVAHCYAGCGLGEIAGMTLAVGVFGLGALAVALTSFAAAFVVGLALTIGPLVQEGMSWRDASRDALLAETPSIAVMEITAIGVGLAAAGGANIHETTYWTSMILSLSCGLIAAYPVNVLLIRAGVKQGMMDPRMTDHHADSVAA